MYVFFRDFHGGLVFFNILSACGIFRVVKEVELPWGGIICNCSFHCAYIRRSYIQKYFLL